MRNFRIILGDDQCRVGNDTGWGIGLHSMEKLLGYESSKVTDIYMHVLQKDFAKYKNPFDDEFFDTS